jgi:hypothetical protein
MAQMATIRRTEPHATLGGLGSASVTSASNAPNPRQGSAAPTDVSSLATRAGVAQLAEHNLPKVGVAGSIPVSRSISMPPGGPDSLVVS